MLQARARAASLAAIADATVASSPDSVAVHVGMGNHVDMAQVDAVPNKPSVHVVAHETFHHNVPAYLEGLGELMPLLKAEALDVLRKTLLSEYC